MEWKSKPLPDGWKPKPEERAELDKEVLAAIEMVISPDWKLQKAMLEFLFEEEPTRPQSGSTEPDFLKPDWMPPENWKPTRSETREFLRRTIEENAGVPLEELQFTFELAKVLEERKMIPPPPGQKK